MITAFVNLGYPYELYFYESLWHLFLDEVFSFAVFAQESDVDTIYASTTMKAAQCHLNGLYDDANNLKCNVDKAKMFSIDFYMNFGIDRNIPTDKQDVILVPNLNSVSYDRIRWQTKKQVFKSINFKLFSAVDSSFVIDMEDNKITALWEALNPNNEWQPVEYFQFSGCGNSHMNFLIPKKHYLLLSANYLEGDFATKVRLRLKIGKTVYHSAAFDGSI